MWYGVAVLRYFSQKLQNHAARVIQYNNTIQILLSTPHGGFSETVVITFSNFDSGTKELFQELRWVKLDPQRSVAKAIMMYNIVNGAVAQYIFTHFDHL